MRWCAGSGVCACHRFFSCHKTVATVLFGLDLRQGLQAGLQAERFNEYLDIVAAVK